MTIQHPNKTTEALLEEAKELGHHASSDETMRISYATTNLIHAYMP